MRLKIRGLQKLQKLRIKSTSKNEVIVKLIELLCASVNANEFNSQTAGTLGAIPMLLSLLYEIEDKSGLLLALIQLIYNSDDNLKIFIEENGINCIKKLSENLHNHPELTYATSCLLKYCNQSTISITSNIDCRKSNRQLFERNLCEKSSFSHDDLKLNVENMTRESKSQFHCGFPEINEVNNRKKFKETVSAVTNPNNYKSPKRSHLLFNRLIPPFKPGLTFYLFTVMTKGKSVSEVCLDNITNNVNVEVERNGMESIKMNFECVESGKMLTNLSPKENEDDIVYSASRKRKFSENTPVLKIQEVKGIDASATKNFHMQTENLIYQNNAVVSESKRKSSKLLESASTVVNSNTNNASQMKWPYLLVKDLPDDIQHLIAGVHRFGMDFKKIKETYNFDKNLTARDLYTLWKEVFIHKPETEVS